MLENPGVGTHGFKLLSGYKLKKKSPAIKAGAIIDHNGGLDFFENKVMVYDKPNIGASQNQF